MQNWNSTFHSFQQIYQAFHEQVKGIRLLKLQQCHVQQIQAYVSELFFSRKPAIYIFPPRTTPVYSDRENTKSD